jgi:hypothetical protein
MSTKPTITALKTLLSAVLFSALIISCDSGDTKTEETKTDTTVVTPVPDPLPTTTPISTDSAGVKKDTANTQPVNTPN